MPEVGDGWFLDLAQWAGDVVEALGIANGRLEALASWGVSIDAAAQE